MTFQAISCTGTDNLRQRSEIIYASDASKTQKLAIANTNIN